MSEKSEENKESPAPNGEEKKHNMMHLDIDLTELFTHIPDIKTEEIWKSKEEMSEDYVKLAQMLQLLAVYMARNINEGPEVKDNTSKRILLARTILGVLINNLAISGYDVYGILTEITQETFMKITGRKFILQALGQIAQASQIESKKRSQDYTM
jgi:hypothetical protein